MERLLASHTKVFTAQASRFATTSDTPTGPAPPPAGDTDTSGRNATFRRLLLSSCQAAFEAVPDNGVWDPKDKARYLGNVKFIGELYKKRMLSDKIMVQLHRPAPRRVTPYGAAIDATKLLAADASMGEWLERHGIAELGAELGDTDI